MKEFEKWLKEYSKKTGYLYDDYAKRERHKGFVGALEWALGRIRDESISYEQAHIEIEQELLGQ